MTTQIVGHPEKEAFLTTHVPFLVGGFILLVLYAHLATLLPARPCMVKDLTGRSSIPSSREKLQLGAAQGKNILSTLTSLLA